MRALTLEEIQATEVLIDQTLKLSIEHDKELSKTEEERETERAMHRMRSPRSFLTDVVGKGEF